MPKCKKCGRFYILPNRIVNGVCFRCQIQGLNDELSVLRTPEVQNYELLCSAITKQEAQLRTLKETIAQKERVSADIDASISSKKAELNEIDMALCIEEVGLYTPDYELMNSEHYKNELAKVTERQKQLVKNDTAVLGAINWSVNGSTAEGSKMLGDMKKLILRAFNGECDGLISKVKYNNYERSLERIRSSCEKISKFGKVMQLSISDEYRDLKIDELTIAFQYARAKQQEKEELKEKRQRLKEEEQLARELEAKRVVLVKESSHYQKEMQRLTKQLEKEPDNEFIKAKLDEVTNLKNKAEEEMKDVDLRAKNAKAGYVYIISNVGSFGENVFKIGMTRRLDPQERIDELGDASVPFNFDVHALIFSEDAPALEALLHKAFENKKVNLMNPRREFFRVSLDEIKEVVFEKYDKTVEFIDVPEATQFRMSEDLRK